MWDRYDPRSSSDRDRYDFADRSLVKKHFGDVPLSAITATTIADFQNARHDAGIANRTINMDVGVLSRVLKFCGRWRVLADHVKNLPERQRPIGRALTSEERRRLFDVAASNPEWEHVDCAAIVAANTSMRPVEVKHIRRCDVDLVKRLLHVRRSKNETSHRVIPLNASAIEAVARMLERADLLGHGAGALPLARMPMGTIRSDEADVEVGHGLARAT
jgi:integrase